MTSQLSLNGETPLELAHRVIRRAHERGDYTSNSLVLAKALVEALTPQSESAFFKTHELEALAKTPDALELLADWHECQISMDDAINDGGVFDGSIKHHEGRKDELMALAKKLREAE